MQDILQEPIFHWTLRVFLAALFASAAISKLTSLEEFYGVVRNFRLVPEGVARAIAMVLPVAELAVAVGLLVTAFAVPAAVVAAVLLLGFAVAIGINVLRGRTQIDCGCFRNGMKQRISWAMVGRNIALTAMALGVVALLPTARATGLADLTTGILAGAVLILLYFSVSMLGSMVARTNSTASAKGH